MNTSRWLIRLAHGLSVGAVALAAQAQTAPAAPNDTAAHTEQLQARAQFRDQERAEIAAQRSRIESLKREAEAACWQKFAVENCLSDVRAQARERDKPLRELELRLAGEERQEKAQERLRAIEQKQQAKNPVPMTAHPRDGSGPWKTEADPQQLQAERQSAARQRARELAERQREATARQTEHERQQAAEAAKAVQEREAKAAAAEARRARKLEEDTGRRGVPLPIPNGWPPKSTSE